MYNIIVLAQFKQLFHQCTIPRIPVAWDREGGEQKKCNVSLPNSSSEFKTKIIIHAMK